MVDAFKFTGVWFEEPYYVLKMCTTGSTRVSCQIFKCHIHLSSFVFLHAQAGWKWDTLIRDIGRGSLKCTYDNDRFHICCRLLLKWLKISVSVCNEEQISHLTRQMDFLVHLRVHGNKGIWYHAPLLRVLAGASEPLHLISSWISKGVDFTSSCAFIL